MNARQNMCTTPVTWPSFSMLPVESVVIRIDEAKQGHNQGWHR